MITRPQKPSLWALLFSIRGTIVPAIWPKVLFTVLISSAVVATHGTLFNYHVVLTATPFTLWGLTLAIFLGFRNTVAYQRFWEARTLWSELSIVVRNLTRQSLSLMPDLAPQQRRHLLDSLMGFSYVLKDWLRGAKPGEDAIRLLGAEQQAVFKTHNPPSALLGMVGQQLMLHARQQNVSDVLKADMDQQLSRLSYVLGGCERISNTPIPYPYILMLHRIVHVYCFLLPFCLVQSIGWFTPFAVLVLAYTFFGLDALGDQIADPFDTQPNDLPLNALCRDLEISVLDMLGEPAPEPMQPINNVQL